MPRSWTGRPGSSASDVGRDRLLSQAGASEGLATLRTPRPRHLRRRHRHLTVGAALVFLCSTGLCGTALGAPFAGAAPCTFEGPSPFSLEDTQAATAAFCRELSRAGADDVAHELRIVGEAPAFFVIGARADGERRRTWPFASATELPEASRRVAWALLGSPADRDVASRPAAPAASEQPRGQRHFSGAVLVVAMLGNGALYPGFSLGYLYERRAWAVGLQLTVAGTSTASPQYVSGGVWARFFVGQGGVAPFAGVGLSFLASEVACETCFYKNGRHEYNLPAPSVEGGVSFLRDTGYRVLAGVRMDVPLYSHRVEDDDGFPGRRADTWVVPLTVQLGFQL